MRYVLAILFPPIGVLTTGRVGAFFLNILLCLLFVIPGIIHAILVVNKYYADERHKELMQMQGMNRGGNVNVNVNQGVAPVGQHQQYPQHQHPNHQHPQQHYPNQQHPQQHYPNPQHPQQHYPNPQHPQQHYPNPQHPQQQYPNQQHPQHQYQNPQYPQPQYPNQQQPLHQYPSQNPVNPLPVQDERHLFHQQGEPQQQFHNPNLQHGIPTVQQQPITNQFEAPAFSEQSNIEVSPPVTPPQP